MNSENNKRRCQGIRARRILAILRQQQQHDKPVRLQHERLSDVEREQRVRDIMQECAESDGVLRGDD